MIITTIELSVCGNTYEEILSKAKTSLADFLDTTTEEISKKCNFEIRVEDNTDSTNFDEFDYSARVVAQVKNV